jgi:hypothetical protein
MRLFFAALAIILLVGVAKADHPVSTTLYCTTQDSMDELVASVSHSQEAAYAAGRRLMSDADWPCYGFPGMVVGFTAESVESEFVDYTGNRTCILRGKLRDGTEAWVPADYNKCYPAIHKTTPKDA